MLEESRADWASMAYPGRFEFLQRRTCSRNAANRMNSTYSKFRLGAGDHRTQLSLPRLVVKRRNSTPEEEAVCPSTTAIHSVAKSSLNIDSATQRQQPQGQRK